MDGMVLVLGLEKFLYIKTGGRPKLTADDFSDDVATTLYPQSLASWKK